MDNVATAALVIVPLVMAVTGIYKSTFGGGKRLPLINLVLGIITGILWGFSFAPTELIIYVWAGALAGMAAGGFYDLGVNTKAAYNQSKAENMIDEGLGKQDTREGE